MSSVGVIYSAKVWQQFCARVGNPYLIFLKSRTLFTNYLHNSSSHRDNKPQQSRDLISSECLDRVEKNFSWIRRILAASSRESAHPIQTENNDQSFETF
jgi:hypothetical protein